MNLLPEHYPPEAWADFVRQTLDHATRDLMAAHLATGCQTCAAEVDWLRSVVSTAALGPLPEPPPELVAAAKSIFGQPGLAEKGPPSWQTWIADLVLVSTGDLLPLGVRGGSAIGERLVYRAAGFLVDLTMDEGLTFDQPGEIIGQVTSGELATELGGVVVQLHSGSKVTGETETNRFGEFILQRPTPGPASLRIFLPGKIIEVRLSERKKKK